MTKYTHIMICIFFARQGPVLKTWIMVQYKLIYFNLRGRAEISRLLFAHAGVEYEDKRVASEEFQALKPSEE